jgi:lipoprotein NlpI
MKMQLAAYASILAASLAASGAWPAEREKLAPEWRFCGSEWFGELDVRIRSCTALIESRREPRSNRAIAYNNRGNAYKAKGELDRAIADYDQAIALDLSDARVYLNRGLAYDAKGDHDRAIADFDQAIRRDSRMAPAYVGRGAAYKAKGNLDRAIADLDQAIRLDPTYDVAFNNRGIAYRDKGDFDRAIADLDQAIRLDPKYAPAYRIRGTAYQAKGDLDRAIADHTEAIRRDAKLASAYTGRGDAWTAKYDYEHAIADYTEAIGLDPSWSTYFARGRANLYAGTLAQAIADIGRASALDAKNAYSALWLEIAVERGNAVSGLAAASRQIDMTRWPGPLIRLYLGQLTSEVALAAADDADASTRRDQVCEANFYVGELALQRGAKEEAVRLFRLAAADCPKAFIEYTGAAAELRMLEAARTTRPPP